MQSLKNSFSVSPGKPDKCLLASLEIKEPVDKGTDKLQILKDPEIKFRVLFTYRQRAFWFSIIMKDEVRK